MRKLPKLRRGDKVAILSPSFAGPAVWPHVYELGLQRIRDEFGLVPVEYPTTKQLNAPSADRARDLIAAFENPDIKAVIATLGGDDQVTYVRNLPIEPFASNPKPFFGASDNTHIANHLWLAGVPSYYGATVLTQFAMQKRMDRLTTEYLRHALFDSGEYEIVASPTYNDINLDWFNESLLTTERTYEENSGWQWDGTQNVTGSTWGGCVESVDELLRHNVPIPTLDGFSSVVLMLETSEELPSPAYVRRVYRALGERGILGQVKGLLVGRAKAWNFSTQNSAEQKAEYKKQLSDMTLEIVRQYNSTMPIIQNIDFGHTDPQIALPYGGEVRIDSTQKKIFATF
jgi:muramoyltetrapeptide carboxypeptidase LdcA involved in peptidoglycan recycling